MADDPERDIIPTKETKQSYQASEINEKHSPEKRFALHLSKTDLEDQIYRFKEENFQLKKATKKQEDDLKRLTTKMNRLLREKKSMEIMNSPGHKRDIELEEMVEDLQDKVRHLERANTHLREKALVAKQQVIIQNRRPNPYNHIASKVNSGIYKTVSSAYVSSINLRGKNFQNLSKKPTSTPIPPYALSLLDEARNELSNLKMLVSSQKAEIDMYEQENDILKQKMRMRDIEFEDELNALKSQLTQRQRQHVQENLDLIRLHREVQQKNTKIINIQAQYNDLEEKMRLLKLNHEHLIKDMDELAMRYKNEQKKNLELVDELQKAEISSSSSSELQENIKTLKSENDVLREKYDKLLQNALVLEKERTFNQMEEILKGKIGNLESRLEIELKSKASIEEELNKEKNKLKSKDEAYNQLKDHVEQMKLRLQNLEAKIDIMQLEEIEFDQLEKAIKLLKQSKEQKSPENQCKSKNCNLNNSDETSPKYSPIHATNEQKQLTSEVEGSPSLETGKSKDLISMEFSKEIEELKYKLSEMEDKNAAILQELQSVRDMLVTQQNATETAEENVRLLTEKLDQQEKEFQIKLEEYSHLLDIRAARVQKLEKQLNDIAFGTKTFLVPASTTDAKTHSPVKLSRGENIFEIHIKEVNFSAEGIKKLYSSNSNIFLTWNFYEFELQSTPLVSSIKPIFNFTAQYTVQVDDYFLSYLLNSEIVLELHESLGVDFCTLASCQINFSDLFKETVTQMHGTRYLIGKESPELNFGTIKYSVQLKILMEEAFKSFKEKMKALKYIHSNKEMSTTAVQMLKQSYDNKSNVNQLNIKILRAENLKSRQKDVQPSAFCVYKFYNFPDQDTCIIPASNNPQFSDHHSFPVYIHPDVEKYLKTEKLLIYVFDDNDPDISCHIGKVAIPLDSLIQNEAIKGSFALLKEDGSNAGSLELIIYWEHKYQLNSSVSISQEPCIADEEIFENISTKESTLNSEEEINASKDPTFEYTVATPPVPKPRSLLTQKMTSTPVSNSSGLSSNSNGIPHGSSPDVSPVHQIESKKSFLPKPAQRKSKQLDAQKSEKLDKIKKLCEDELSDDVSSIERKISFDDESDEDKLDFDYGYSEESESETDIYSEPPNAKPISQVPSITILVSYLSLMKDAAVLQESTIKLLYIEYQFLNYPLEELETPVSLPKKSFPERIVYNFKKVFTLEPNNLEKWNLLLNMFSSDSTQSSKINFTVVSEPPPEEQDLDCEDVGYGSVDLREILMTQRDKIQEDVPIYDASDSTTRIGSLNISIQALEALSMLKTFHLSSSSHS